MKSILITVAAALCVTAILFLIVNNLIKNMNILKRGWINLGLGGIGFVVFLVAFLIDDLNIIQANGFSYIFKSYYYLRSPIMALCFLVAGLGLGLTFLMTAKKAHIHSTGWKWNWNSKESPKSKVSRSEYEEYIVLVYQREENVYFQPTQPMSLVKIKDSHNKFSSDFIQAINNKLGVIMKSDDSEGAITVMGTITDDTHSKFYECYLIHPLNDPQGLTPINPRDLSQYDIIPLDREIALRVLMREPFDIHK